ncbi:hypothetical protein HU200_038160 [Digitaria exilis]|uniref:Peptidase A1 domain-containing protein n=1 Tax=Digitaria exilis TaxID=1010633 RepID=A0A835BDD1_9POAL|nr:hypothetical protein HU200_038160 [Digitaria exilis]
MTMSPSYSTTSSSSDTRPTRLFSGEAEYLMELAVGTPPIPFIALADTGSDLTWTQCQPCKLCFAQDTPIYDPTMSSTFSPATCASDTCLGLPVWSTNCSAPGATSPCRSSDVVSIAGITFGCGVDNGSLSYNSNGTVGLGRGSLSLVSQLGIGKFSYCLTDFFDTNISSPFLFGSLAKLSATGGAAVQSTPLIQNLERPARYFVSLEGISLGDTLLLIPNGTFDLRADGSGGMFIDSGTTFTILAEPGFGVVVEHVAGVLGQPATAVNGSSLCIRPCFPAPAGARKLPEMPDMVFRFAGGADMRLRRENYMSFDEEVLAFCLNIVGTKPTWISVLGNFQQQNIQMLYDITVGQLSFVATDCGML